jgi:hypothetical protein
MGCGCAKREHADQPGQSSARVGGRPGDHHFHAQRIDPGEAEAGQEAKQAIPWGMGRRQDEARIRERAEQARRGENPTGGKSISEAGGRKDKCADDESRLDAQRQPAKIALAQA